MVIAVAGMVCEILCKWAGDGGRKMGWGRSSTRREKIEFPNEHQGKNVANGTHNKYAGDKLFYQFRNQV